MMNEYDRIEKILENTSLFNSYKDEIIKAVIENLKKEDSKNNNASFNITADQIYILLGLAKNEAATIAQNDPRSGAEYNSFISKIIDNNRDKEKILSKYFINMPNFVLGEENKNDRKCKKNTTTFDELEQKARGKLCKGCHRKQQIKQDNEIYRGSIKDIQKKNGKRNPYREFFRDDLEDELGDDGMELLDDLITRLLKI